jgi:DNA-binding CsgD family transcriptional regulator
MGGAPGAPQRYRRCGSVKSAKSPVLATERATLGGMLLGRVKERAAIEALLERARAGHGGGLLLHGEPGIGKSALLSYAAERAGSRPPGMRVLRTVGVEPESDLGHATLHRLLLPALGSISELPQPQARALRVVFGQTDGPAPDRFLVALATLSLLSEIACERPVLCLVDDAQWADAPSLDALAFVARRLDAEPIALALASRADEGRPLDRAGLIELPLAGLDEEAARALLAERVGERLSAAEQNQLLRATAGNPLAIRELRAPARQGAGLAEPLPLAAGLQRAFLARARQRDPRAQGLLLLVAAEGSGRCDTIRRAAAALGCAADLPGSGELDELITRDGSRLSFRHPLIRSAIYHGASPAERRAAHRALAAALAAEPAGLDRRAWHLGQAADGPDEPVAEELERSAERATQRAGPAAAAAALERAAELSASEPCRARRWVAAATAWWQGGHAGRAAALLERAERVAPPAREVRLEIAALRALIELRTGTPSDALALLLPVIPDLLRADRDQAVRLLMLLGEASFHANAAAAWNQIAGLADRLPPHGAGPEAVLFRLFGAACRARAGADPGLAPGDLDALEQLADPARLGWAGGMAWGLGNHDLARRLHRKAVLRARALGAAGTLAWVLEYLVADELARGRFATAEAYAEEGHRFAVETGQPNTACRHQGSLAVLAALRGRELQARRLAEGVLVEAGKRQLASATAAAYRALGLLDLAAGRPTEAMEHLQAMDRDCGRAHPGIMLATVPELVEAAARADQPDRAAEPLDRFATWAEATRSPELRALVARCHALLASADAAEAGFRLALELHARTDAPMEQARTELLYGEHLRRERRRAEARPHLREALRTFQRLGASTWADRARDELRATGETARRRQPGALATLTPQELRIVAAVSEGASNREIAAQLFLSPRTIAYHLRKVFQKTGISSRGELIRLAMAGRGDDQEP